MSEIKCCQDCKNDPEYAEQCTIQRETPSTTVPCEHGVYFPHKNYYARWGITPSSEDKGYCHP